jgi:predicted molibdopterin-dependent oxidoreductase YjgC
MITVTVNGASLEVPDGTTVAAAVMRAGVTGFRPLCGMGVCFECRITLNGRPYERSCQTLCEPGMEVRTDA